MDTMRRAYHGKGGGGGGGGGGRRLERRNATKHISYDSHSRKPRRSLDSDQSSYDESESSSHSREDWSLDEYRVLGSSSVEEMSNVCRYLGLPGPASLGIGREAWESAKWHNSTGAAGGDSMFSGTQEDPSDFTFVVSPPPSNAPTSPQESFRYPHGRGKDVAFDHEVGDDGLSTSPSKHRNDADAADVANFIEEHREQEQQSHRLLPLWRNRSTSMPATQSRPMSPPRNSVVLEGSHKTSLLGSKIFHYPDPTMHILRARSQPVLPSAMSPGSGEAHAVREEKSNYNTSQTRSLPSSAVTKSPVDQHGSRDRSTDPALVTSREVPMPRLVDSSSRSSSSSDGSGEFINREPAVYARADKVVPEQRSSEKKQDVGREQAVAAFRPGSLSKPPPRSVLYLPPDAFSTHDLLSSLGPPDASVEVVGKRDSQSDSEDDERPEDSASGQYSPSPVSSKSLRENADVARPVEEIHSPQDPVFEVRDLSSAVQIVVKSTGNTDVDARAPRDEGKDTSEDRPSEIESNGAERSSGVDVQEATTSPTEDVMPIDPTQSPVPAEGGTHDLRPLADDEMRVQTVTDPWTKGDLLGAGSFGTVYEAVDSNGSFFAVKEVSLTDTDRNSQQCISQLEQEIELLSRFKHDNIVQYLGTQRADGKLYIFLELVSKGSLASLCKKFKLTHSQIVAYTRQILKGLKYLHDMNIVHRDIKCANILVDVEGTCKLADFGLAKQISALDQLKSCKGSAYWMAPEVIDPKKTYWLPADIWSLGCSVLEMFTGSPPFGDQEWYRVLWKVGHGEAPPIPEELSDDAKDFIQQCLDINPSRRPTATVLLEHRFLASSMTPTNSGQLNPQMVVSSLGTITEERSGDFSRSSGTSKSEGSVEISSLEVKTLRDRIKEKSLRAQSSEVETHRDRIRETLSQDDPSTVTDSSLTLGTPENLDLANPDQQEPLPISPSPQSPRPRRLRSDLTAIGLRGLNDIFDPRQIVCIYGSRAPENAIEMFFLHVHGMTLFIGVGLPHAQVLLQADGIVKVREIQEAVWSEVWMEYRMNEYTLLLLDSTSWSHCKASDTFPPEVSDPVAMEPLSSEDAAGHFGVGVEGIALSRDGGINRKHSLNLPRPPRWIKTFVDSLLCNNPGGNNAGEGSSQGDGIRSNSGESDSVIMSDDPMLVEWPDSNLSGQISERNGEAVGIDQGREEGQFQPLQLTVIVYLDSSNCSYFKGSDPRNQMQFRLAKDSRSDLSNLIDPSSLQSVRNIRNAIDDFEINPTVTITFLYTPDLGSRCSKKLTTTLDVHYHLDSNIQDQRIFGWYHDQLRLSFRCKEPNQVRRLMGGLDVEVLSKHEYRGADHGQSKEKSTLKISGKGGERKLVVGHKNWAYAEGTRNSRTENTEGTNGRQNSEVKISATCLMQNYAISDKSGKSHLEYLATIFPPLELFDIWDMIDRSLLFPTGIMSAVPLQIEGNWIVKEENAAPCSSEDVALRFCQYDFSCQRDLIQHEQIEIERQIKKSRCLPVKVNDHKEMSKEVLVDKMLIQQKLSRNFLINHSFSHMQGLRRPYPYEWNLIGQPEAPCPKPVNQLVS